MLLINYYILFNSYLLSLLIGTLLYVTSFRANVSNSL